MKELKSDENSTKGSRPYLLRQPLSIPQVYITSTIPVTFCVPCFSLTPDFLFLLNPPFQGPGLEENEPVIARENPRRCENGIRC